jgi:hypothetical protein
MLKKEELDGDNQYVLSQSCLEPLVTEVCVYRYFCEICNSKQNATRKSALLSLPPVRPCTSRLFYRTHGRLSQVLHFSIMRFTWNMKDLSRSKSTHAISYPLQVDMGEFLPPDERTGEEQEVWYDLRGVLMHKGGSAHHGHYVAQGYDETQVFFLLPHTPPRLPLSSAYPFFYTRSLNKWYLFDDEDVSAIDDLNAPTPHDEDGEPVKSNKKPGTGFTRDAKGAMCVLLPPSKKRN